MICYLAQYHTYHTQHNINITEIEGVFFCQMNIFLDCRLSMYYCYAFALFLILTTFVMMVYPAKCCNPTSTFVCAVHFLLVILQSSAQTGATPGHILLRSPFHGSAFCNRQEHKHVQFCVWYCTTELGNGKNDMVPVA